MDVFFRRHFKRKPGEEPEEEFGRLRRPSVAVATSRARRRSSVGLPSSALAQRRRSSAQLQGPVLATRGHGSAPARPSRPSGSRRRSSTTTPSANPRFAVRRRLPASMRTIHTHLLGPSMLLASLIQMSEEEEGPTRGPAPAAAECQVELRAACATQGLSDSDSNSQSEDSHDSEVEVSDREFEDTSAWRRRESQTLATLVECVAARPLIRAPRCLRRNSSLVVTSGAIANGRVCRSGQHRQRRVSTISKAGSPWPGRGLPLPSRRNSTCRRISGCHGNISPLLGAYYDPRLESWPGFLSYVSHPKRLRSRPDHTTLPQGISTPSTNVNSSYGI